MQNAAYGMNVSDVAQVCFECLGAELLVEDMA